MCARPASDLMHLSCAFPPPHHEDEDEDVGVCEPHTSVNLGRRAGGTRSRASDSGASDSEYGVLLSASRRMPKTGAECDTALSRLRATL